VPAAPIMPAARIRAQLVLGRRSALRNQARVQPFLARLISHATGSLAIPSVDFNAQHGTNIKSSSKCASAKGRPDKTAPR
jgi:hypothetical protein